MKKIFAAALFAYAASAGAVDGVSAETGRGTRDVDLWRLGLQWHAHADWLAATRWRLYWDLSAGGWHSDLGTVHDVGLTPVFRYAGADHGVFYEAAIGFHVLSDSHINSDLGFSTRFQFGDHLAVGYRFEGYDLSLRLQHLSNGGMRNPNPGINFLELRGQYWLK
ncbi:MAG TPA: acyloxyacyl hydrolase [Burkholderiales bacterium]